MSRHTCWCWLLVVGMSLPSIAWADGTSSDKFGDATVWLDVGLTSIYKGLAYNTRSVDGVQIDLGLHLFSGLSLVGTMADFGDLNFDQHSVESIGLDWTFPHGFYIDAGPATASSSFYVNSGPGDPSDPRYWRVDSQGGRAAIGFRGFIDQGPNKIPMMCDIQLGNIYVAAKRGTPRPMEGAAVDPANLDAMNRASNFRYSWTALNFAIGLWL